MVTKTKHLSVAGLAITQDIDTADTLETLPELAEPFIEATNNAINQQIDCAFSSLPFEVTFLVAENAYIPLRFHGKLQRDDIAGGWIEWEAGQMRETTFSSPTRIHYYLTYLHAYSRIVKHDNHN